MASHSSEVADKLEALTTQLAGFITGLRDGSLSLASSPSERMTLIRASRGIIEAIKQPQDDIMESLPKWPEAVVIRLFLQWKAFEIIPKDGSIPYEELASKLDADVALISTKTEVPCSHILRRC
jgi:hypothetical protein